MNNQSIFKSLPEEDQQRILDLCSTHTYDDVLEIIARPRPEGLQIKSSASALCRFNCSRSAEARKASVISQNASGLQYIRQDSSGSVRTGILAMIENRIFEALRSGQPISDLQDEFSALKEVHKGFLAEEKWRHEPDVDAKKEVKDHRSTVLRDKHYDFVPCDEQGEPLDIPPLSEDEISRLNLVADITPDDIARLDYRIASEGRANAEEFGPVLGYPRDLIKQRIKVYEENLRTRGITPVQAAIEARRSKLLGPSSSSLPPLKNSATRLDRSANGIFRPTLVENSTQIPPKKPEIAPIPPKSTQKISATHRPVP